MPGIDAKTKPASNEARGVLPAGTRLLSYEIVSVLGQSGFGVTYLAHDTTLDCRVAIKEYLPTSIALREANMGVVPRSAELSEPFAWGRERFLGEVRTLAKLGHAPAVVGIQDLFEANGTAYMVMELAQGESLHRRLLRDKHLPPPVVERLLSSLLQSLEAVHAAGLLHHDIKPANILVDSRGNPTLIDFGAARAAMAGRFAAMAGTFTPDYAAAEQFTSARQGPWTDIYGLSATLYHAITGEPPPSVFHRMLGDSCQPLARLMPAGFAPGLLVGIDAGLRVRASERPQSIAEWRAILPPSGPLDEGAAFVMRGPSAAAAAVASIATGSRRGMRLWVGIAAAAVGVVVVSNGVLKLTAPPTGTADMAHPADVTRPAVAAGLQPPPQDAAVANEAAAKSAPVGAAAPGMAEARAPVEEAALRKAAEEKFAAEAAALRREAEAKERAAASQAALEAAPREAAEEARRPTQASMSQAAAEGKAKPDPEARQQPERAEAALNLSEQDRKRVQAALTALGHEVPATGYFGPITRSMITAWQKTRGLPQTGFLDSSQLAALHEAAQPLLDAPRAEAALNLSEQDRKRVQTALTALGHEVHATGYFGPITRTAITAWQKTQNVPATGYLTDAQLATLKQQAADALAKYDQAQRAARDAQESR